MKCHGIDTAFFCRVLLAFLFVGLLSHCGGGGGNGGSGRPGSAYVSDYSISPSYVLTRSNVPLVTAVFQFETLNPVFLLEDLRSLYNNPVPVFRFDNTRQTVACDYSGSVTITIRGKGSEIEQESQNCQDSADDIIVNGRIHAYLYDVDASQGKFKATVELSDYSESLGNKGTTYSGIQVFSFQLDEQGVVYLDVETHGTVYDQDVGEEYETNLRFQAIYLSFNSYLLAIVDAVGYLNFQNSGAVLVEPDQVRIANLLTGFGGEQAISKLFLDHYAIGYTTGNGEVLSAGVPVSRVKDVDVFAEHNTPVSFVGSQQVKQYFAEDSSKIVLPLDEVFYDPDLDLLNTDITITCSPENAEFLIDLSDPFKATIEADTYGNYAVGITVTDGEGKTASGYAFFDYWKDQSSQSDAVNPCKSIPLPLPELSPPS